MTRALRPLAVTMGEPAGVGGDITLGAWLRRAEDAIAPFFIIDDADRLTRLAQRLNLSVPIRQISAPDEAFVHFAHSLPVLHRPLGRTVEPGQPESANGSAVVASIAEAAKLTSTGAAGAIVTNPIHKKVLYDTGFAFPGHTEYLADLAGGVPFAMMLACSGLRTVPVTIHMSLREAMETLTTESIIECGRLIARCLQQDFGIASPRLAIAGLNPHAGEGGSMGKEEETIIAPAIAALRADGINAFGPLPPDTMFHAARRATYDAALCMYHDQALIPIKTLDFDGGVNVTLGLPFIRTSPDHGTAFDIAGTGKARPESLIAALKLAGELAVHHAA